MNEELNGETAQAEAVEESAPSTGEGQETEKPESKPDDSAERPKKGVQKRIDELTSNWRNAERDRDHWRELALKNQQPEQKTSAMPTLESFGYDETKYQQAMDKWVDDKLNSHLSARERAEVEKQQKIEQQRQFDAFKSKADKFAETVDDYYDIAHDDTLPISQAMAEAIRISDLGPDLLYFFGKNRDQAERIYSLSPTQAALEIGRLEAKLSLPKAKKVTGAPPPINSLSGSGTTQKNPDQMDSKEWLVWRNKQLGR